MLSISASIISGRRGWLPSSVSLIESKGYHRFLQILQVTESFTEIDEVVACGVDLAKLSFQPSLKLTRRRL